MYVGLGRILNFVGADAKLMFSFAQNPRILVSLGQVQWTVGTCSVALILNESCSAGGLPWKSRCIAYYYAVLSGTGERDLIRVPTYSFLSTGTCSRDTLTPI